MKVLVTGGAGYIGSHACLSLLEDGHDVLVIDNLSNGKQEALLRVEQLANRKLRFIKADLMDYKTVKKVFLAAFLIPAISFFSEETIISTPANSQASASNGL